MKKPSKNNSKNHLNFSVLGIKAFMVQTYIRHAMGTAIIKTLIVKIILSQYRVM